ncbi:hypothetical protein [Streptomyces sp. NBC_01443]|uniref:hypothetical protein n=1 Tax=Streptomyces sp. NBC_01443 TaxID=2903868 RepID=UPI00225AAE87|nr:hypothetical protein [Streptomyces sp. NBC_01443]MCX4626050.1 hypothetical protein [Streptomyces sp. NBC_01443]
MRRPRPPRRLRTPLTVLALLAPALLGALGPDGSGETIPLSGTDPGQHLDVTLTRVVDPADPAPTPAPAGSDSDTDSDRLVAVEFRLENTGTAVYQDSPAKSSHLLDSDGERFTGSNTTTTAGPAFPDTVTLAPGGSALGFVTFRLPNDAALAAVQFALNSGLADDVGHWSLP